MRPICYLVFVINVAVILVMCVQICSTKSVSLLGDDLIENQLSGEQLVPIKEWTRFKRQSNTEDLDIDDDVDFVTTGNKQADGDEGFWSKVLRVALKLFGKFMEWMNG